MTRKDSVESVVAQMPRLIQTLGRLHMAGCRTLLEDFGAEGERSVRQWIRRYATWRGHELRKAHMALGLPINVETLQRNWDSAAVYPLMDDFTSWSPYSVRLSVTERPGACPISESWVEADYYRWGHVYCDELHQHLVQAYHPDAAVVIPECMQKRESICNFHYLMPPNASQHLEEIAYYPGQNVLNDWQSNTEEETVLSVLRRTTRILAVMVHYLWEVLKDFHPKQAEEEFAQIIDQWSADRGSALKREREEKGWGAGPEYLYLNYDHPHTITWETRRNETSEGIEIEVTYCPLAETWGWMGSLSAMKPYCVRSYIGVVTNFHASLCAEVSRCKTGGDETCVIKIMSKGA